MTTTKEAAKRRLLAEMAKALTKLHDVNAAFESFCLAGENSESDNALYVQYGALLIEAMTIKNTIDGGDWSPADAMKVPSISAMRRMGHVA
ncbi:MAG TPA: hypothetical protein VIJ67_02510 [Pseudolabrys sp.]